MRKFITILFTAIVATFALASSAFADQSPATLNGKIELSSMIKNGYHPKKKHSKGTHIPSNPKVGDCVTAQFSHSGWKDSTGRMVAVKNKPHWLTHACWDGHNWRQIGGNHNQWNCGNIVYPEAEDVPKNVPVLSRSKVVLVRHFTIKVVVQVTAPQPAAPSVSVNVSPTINVIAGNGNGNGNGSGNTNNNEQSQAQDCANAGTGNTWNWVTHQCDQAPCTSCGGTPPCNCTPPAAQPPTVSSPNVNDVEQGQTKYYGVDYDVPSGHTAKLTFSANSGRFSNTASGSISFTVSGTGQQYATYTAPDEPGTDTITVKITDNTTGLSDSDTTDPFTIKPTVYHPGLVAQ